MKGPYPSLGIALNKLKELKEESEKRRDFEVQEMENLQEQAELLTSMLSETRERLKQYTAEATAYSDALAAIERESRGWLGGYR